MAKRRDEEPEKKKRKPAESDRHEVDEGFVEPDPAAEILDVAVKKTPSWVLSLAFHVMVIAAVGTITFATVKRSDGQGAVTIFQRPVAVEKIQMPESRNRALLDNPVGREDGAEYKPDEKQIQMPEWMPEGDHYESNNGVEGNTFAGDPLSNGFNGLADSGIGRKDRGGPGLTDRIGVGAGSGQGGHWGNGPGGRQWMRKKAPRRTESSVRPGLQWLARHQAPDGHWSADGYCDCCTGTKCVKHDYDKGISDFDTGVTGLALLAFLGAGYTPQIRESYTDPVTKKNVVYGDVVRRGVDWLIRQQDQSGNIGPTHVHEQMYNHAIASLALAEAYGLTNAAKYRAPAQKAIDFIVQAQNYQLGWRYKPRTGDNDTSVTGWCVMALKSAQISGLDVSQTSYVGAKGWVAKVTQDNGNVGYNKLGSGEVCVPGKNEQWQHHTGSMTAVGMLVRIYVDKNKDDPALKKGEKFLLDDLPKWEVGEHPTVDFYYWYYATLTLFQLDGPTGAGFQKWIKPMVDVLCSHQRTQQDGCLDGSWDTGGVDRWGWAGGRVYGTAMNVLTLEVFYRYQSLLGGKK
jgi:hypothetical protein